jgi:hypothetical protein
MLGAESILLSFNGRAQTVPGGPSTSQNRRSSFYRQAPDPANKNLDWV